MSDRATEVTVARLHRVIGEQATEILQLADERDRLAEGVRRVRAALQDAAIGWCELAAVISAALDDAQAKGPQQ